VTTTSLLDDVLAQAAAARELPTAAEARAIREAAGITQQQIGDVVGVDRATICRWESGKRRPRGANVRFYFAVLKRIVEEMRLSP
jgi:transcriptional regulator with XRE-family HTH domain